jgi:chromosome transmission fidelity protein 1
MDVMIQELVPDLSQMACDAQRAISNGSAGFKSDKLVAFSCGHVVPKSNVLLQAITKVDGVSLDMRHKTRSLSDVMNAIGKSILRLAKQVPNGMVVFTGSYRYEQALVDFLKTKAPHIWKELNSTKRLFREPKDSKQTDEVLTSFAESASSDRRGALLFSVMGGKLSEGINFANELCRCVVVIGLPYPDAKDPLLQEKLKLLPGGGGGFSYLRSLCLRSVNQSVGRAIRHANDYAGIVLMDVRYTQDCAIGRGLPKWLTESTPDWKRQDTTLSSAERRLEEFFEFHSVRNEE